MCYLGRVLKDCHKGQGSRPLRGWTRGPRTLSLIPHVFCQDVRILRAGVGGSDARRLRPPRRCAPGERPRPPRLPVPLPRLLGRPRCAQSPLFGF